MTPSVPPLSALSPSERKIATLLAEPHPISNRAIAAILGWKPKSVAVCIERLANNKLPGTLPPRIRVMMWARGAPLNVLNGWTGDHGAYAPPVATVGLQRREWTGRPLPPLSRGTSG